MEALVAIAIGVLAASGFYLILRQRTFPLILGLSLLSYAVNLFLFVSGRLVPDRPPILTANLDTADPLPQALVLTAIVISFAMTAVLAAIAVGAWFGSGTDLTDIATPNGTAEQDSDPDAIATDVGSQDGDKT